MNYIYDILVNFKKIYYDFYEWNKDDKIIHIRKIPTFKITNKDFLNISQHKIKIDKNFLNLIKNKTECFNKKETKNIKYCALFSDGRNLIAVKFDKNGNNQMKSSITIDEQDEIIDIIRIQKETKLKYDILRKTAHYKFKTRFEIENETFIKNELSKLQYQKNKEKIKYIYLECFNKNESNTDKAIKQIKKEITKGNDNFYKIFKIFKIINQNQS